MDILLMGPSGSGKSTMYALTLPEDCLPVHAIDVDCKLDAMQSLARVRAEGKLTLWPLAETYTEESLKARVSNLSKNLRPQQPPKGWSAFAQMVDDLPKKEDSMKAKTWAVDSLTLLAEHLCLQILYEDPKAKATFSPREWGYYKRMWAESITVLRDTARAHGKHLICTVHERVSEVPGPYTKAHREKLLDSEGKAQYTTEYTGTLDVIVAASIDGSFGNLIGAHFGEVYGLSVEIEGGEPVWKCRVKPDGKRALRTSFNVPKSEYNPSFKEIWADAQKEAPAK